MPKFSLLLDNKIISKQKYILLFPVDGCDTENRLIRLNVKVLLLEYDYH